MHMSVILNDGAICTSVVLRVRTDLFSQSARSWLLSALGEVFHRYVARIWQSEVMVPSLAKYSSVKPYTYIIGIRVGESLNII
jgi:hypothetical protein